MKIMRLSWCVCTTSVMAIQAIQCQQSQSHDLDLPWSYDWSYDHDYDFIKRGRGVSGWCKSRLLFIHSAENTLGPSANIDFKKQSQIIFFELTFKLKININKYLVVNFSGTFFVRDFHPRSKCAWSSQSQSQHKPGRIMILVEICHFWLKIQV